MKATDDSTDPLTRAEVQALADLLAKATQGPWKLWDGNSWRRFGSENTGCEVITPTTHPRDGHVDLCIPNAADGELVVAAVNALPRLLAMVREPDADFRRWVDEQRQILGLVLCGSRAASFAELLVLASELTGNAALEQMPKPPIDPAALDPGIREVVATLRANGFETTDSGDGVSKPADARWFDCRHVSCVVTSEAMVRESHRLQALLGDGWRIEASYSPSDRTCVIVACEGVAAPPSSPEPAR